MMVTDAIGLVVNRMNTILDSNDRRYKKWHVLGLNNSVKYMYGHFVEVNSRLEALEKDDVKSFEKFPLLALRLDEFPKKSGGMLHHDLNIVIMHKTENKDAIAPQRMSDTIKPILWPLYELFMECLVSVRKFTWEGDGVPHTPIIRPYWGTAATQGNVANTFSDRLDAVEIQNLLVNQVIKNC